MSYLKSQVKLALKTVVPYDKLEKVFAIYRTVNISSQLKVNKARKIFEQAIHKPIHLDPSFLDILQKEYSVNFVESADTNTLLKRGKQQVKELLDVISQEKASVNNFLELGCGKGTVSYILHTLGKTTTAIDMDNDSVDKSAISGGLNYLSMDAAKLQFADESFDFIFSYNAFEHFPDPKAVLKEATRVVKTGGYIYFNFAPLYMSPWGLHAMEGIHFPYCQFLFPKDLLEDFVKSNGVEYLGPFVNEWSLEDYRNLWNLYSHKLKKCIYSERTDIGHLDLIMKYPSVFKSKTNCFDNLICSGIRILLKKI